MSEVRMTVVMAVGPRCDPDFVNDTLASIEHYAQPGYRLILIDDSGTAKCNSLRRPNDTTILKARAKGTLGALYLNLSDGFRSALEQPFDILLRIDTDGLVIGGGFEDAAAEFFCNHPSVGCLGPHNQHYDGTSRSFAGPRKQIVRHLTVRWSKTPATSAVLARLVLRASLHGYRLGESVLGGVCIYSQSAIHQLETCGLLGDPRLGRSQLEEDHIFGLAMRACRIGLSDFGSTSDTLPIGSRWIGLAASPGDLVEAKKALIHSTRSWQNMDEVAIRAYFARRRNRAESATVEGLG